MIVEKDHLPAGRRIVVCSPYPLTKDTPDGVARFILESRPFFEAEGHKVILVSPPSFKGGKSLADENVGRPIRFPFNKTSVAGSYFFDTKKAMHFLRREQPDIMIFHEPFAAHQAHTFISAAQRLADPKEGIYLPTRFIGTFHSQAEQLTLTARIAAMIGHRVKRPKFRNGIGLTDGYPKTVIEGFSGLIAVSHATADFWKSITPDDYRVGGFEVIPNGFDTNLFTPDGPKIDRWQEDGKKTILFAGRHDPRKGIPDLIIAFSQLVKERDDIQLKITGGGQETENLRGLVKELDICDSVEFTGVLPFSDLIKAYRTADILVSPARGGEGFGRVLAEAMLCQTSFVIGSDINGYREVIGGKDFARMTPPEDPLALALTINEVLNLPQERKEELGREAREYVVENYSWKGVVGQTLDYALSLPTFTQRFNLLNDRSKEELLSIN